MKNTFDTYKSLNLRLHNKLSQHDQYSGYLRRIETIVDKKHCLDKSSDFYMTFLNRSRQRSNQHKFLERQYLIQLENKHLLQKIQKEKNRKLQKNNSLHEINLCEKRIREQQKINQQNSKMAQRIMKQNSYLVNKSILVVDHHKNSPEKSITNKRMTDMKFFDSRIKIRKLPKLVKSPSKGDTECIR